MVTISAQEAFQRLAAGDPRLFATIGDVDSPDRLLPRLDDRTETLMRIAALVAVDAPESSYRVAVGAAERAGADQDDLVGVLGAIAGAVGSARVIAAAPRIATAIGLDLDPPPETAAVDRDAGGS